MINKIRVIPKKDDNRLLEGDLFIVEDLWCISAADVNVRATGLKAKIKITCKEVQSSVFLPVSITTSSTIDIMGFKAEASYLAAIHYREVKRISSRRPVRINGKTCNCQCSSAAKET